MKIYVTRHGQTDWNVRRSVSGITDIPLDDTGRRQAQQLGEAIKGKGIDLVITSNLGRAVETGTIAAAAIGAPVLQDERLHERDFGAMEGVSYDDPEFIRQNRQFACKIGGGESVLQVAQRIYNCLDELPQKYPGKTLLLVAHGAAARVIHTYFISMTNEEYWETGTGNCQLREYDL